MSITYVNSAKDIIQLALAVITIIGALSIPFRFLWKRQQATGKGVQALLRNEILGKYHHCTKRQSISFYELETINKMYEEYHNLGGNGIVTKFVEDLRKLPVVES